MNAQQRVLRVLAAHDDAWVEYVWKDRGCRGRFDQPSEADLRPSVRRPGGAVLMRLRGRTVMEMLAAGHIAEPAGGSGIRVARITNAGRAADAGTQGEKA